MTYAWFGCEAGASGDMFLGALVDAGAPLEGIAAAVDALGVEPIELSAAPAARAGVTATQVTVGVPSSDVVRTWANVRHLIERADLAGPVRSRALAVFARLAAAEARAHRVSIEQVHFHEVGALDALADVVGTCTALHLLGVTAAGAGPVSLGSGMVRSEHGLLPVPGPAVLALLADAGAPVRGGAAAYELCTPTGAALLAEVVTRWGDLPPMRLTSSGYGAGGRDLDEVPNVLRVVLGEPLPGATSAPAEALVLSANVDDLDPRVWPHVLTRLLEAGADDAWLTPILMKKGRPAHTISVLTPASLVGDLCDILVRETSTLGVREAPVGKQMLERDFHTVDVRGRPVRVKRGSWQGEVVNVQPEYEDVAAAAAAVGAPVKLVLAEAVAAAQERPAPPPVGDDEPA